MKPFILHREAESELDEAIAHYETQRPGLGIELLSEVEQAIGRIQEHPRMFARYGSRGLRKCPIRRFPYTIFYRELEDRIWIAAVAHQKRRPGYWARRKPE